MMTMMAFLDQPCRLDLKNSRVHQIGVFVCVCVHARVVVYSTHYPIGTGYLVLLILTSIPPLEEERTLEHLFPLHEQRECCFRPKF